MIQRFELFDVRYLFRADSALHSEAKIYRKVWQRLVWKIRYPQENYRIPGIGTGETSAALSLVSSDGDDAAIAPRDELFQARLRCVVKRVALQMPHSQRHPLINGLSRIISVRFLFSDAAFAGVTPLLQTVQWYGRDDGKWRRICRASHGLPQGGPLLDLRLHKIPATAYLKKRLRLALQKQRNNAL